MTGDWAAPAPVARRLVMAALMALCLAIAAACSSGDGATTAKQEATPAATRVAGAATVAGPAAMPDQFPLTLAGTDGSSVRLAKAPRRIVSLSAGGTETLFAIGAGSAVVAADRFSDYPEAVKALPKVEYTRPSIESLAALQPDLILAAGRQKDSVAAIQAAGLPIVMLEEPANLQGVLDRVRLLGRATGRTVEAEALVAQMEGRIAAVKDRVASVSQGPRIFHELSAALYTAAPQSFVGDLYGVLKARNIAEGATAGYPQLSQEAIVQRDPEVIVLADGREGVTVEQVRSRPGWSAIAAVRAGRIYLLTDVEADITSRPGPRVVEALETLVKLLYP